jgi:hypothetical protein
MEITPVEGERLVGTQGTPVSIVTDEGNTDRKEHGRETKNLC